MRERKVLAGFLIFAILTLIFMNLSEALKSLNVENLNPLMAQLVGLLKYLFGNSAVVFAVGYLRNLLGFLENWFRARYSRSEIEYELGKLGETWVKYQAGVLAISSWLPSPVAAAITFILDLITSSIQKLRQG